jgi:anti-sigma regulatory factor (Ser/Thr protein kinase)
METIKVKVPASPRYVGVVRLVAAGLASRLGFTIDDIEDLKIAVDELAAYLTGPQGRDGSLEIHFHVHDDRIEIEGFGLLAPGHGVRTDLTDLSRQILDTVVDRASLSQADGRPVFSLMKAKTG